MIKKLKQEKFYFACILTTGRTGSDFLQGCLDGIPGVITFSGQIAFYTFLKDEKTKKYFAKKDKKNLIKYFVRKHPKLFFKDILENKIINLNLKKFNKIFLELSKDKDLNRKNFLLYIYLSYHLTLNRKIFKNNTIVHHSHSVEETKRFCEDFDNTKILVTIRHPFQNLKSGIINWVNYDVKRNDFSHFYFYIKRIREDLIFAVKKKSLFIKLEEINLMKTKKKICKFLHVNFSPKIHTSSFANKPWESDKLSSFKSKKGKFNNSVLKQDWQKFFSKNDQKILSLLYKNYSKFGYKIKKNNFLDKLSIFPLIFLPLNYEKNNIIKILFSKSILSFSKNVYYYFRRVLYYLKVYCTA